MTELLDAMDAAVERLRGHAGAVAAQPAPTAQTGPYTTFAVRDSATDDTVHWTFSVAQSGPSNTSHQLRVQMDLAGLSKTAFAALFDVPVASVDDWLSGVRPVPPWVLRAIHVFGLLQPAERERLLGRPRERVGARGRHRHPFSRIEEL